MSETDCPADPSIPASMSRRAAAVPYRRTPRGVEFLLVRTRRRGAWTFPKGHIEGRESARRAAQREAKEEAAVSGRIDDAAFTRYRYPTWESGMPGEVCVEAYLMEADAAGGVEAERPTMWVGPEEAVKRLAQNREPAYAREHLRVVREAVARIAGVSPPPR